MARLKTKHGVIAVTLAVFVIGGFEGLRNYAYKDPVGIPTICFGETRNVHMGEYKTTAQCKSMLTSRVIGFGDKVDQIIHVPISDKTYAAFTSFAYNVGIGAFRNSTLVRKANAGDLVGACHELSRWVYAGGRKLPGLVKRRAAEEKLCLEGLK